MPKATRLTIRLGDDVRAWLKAEGDKRGLDEAAFARMLLYSAMNGATFEIESSRRGSPRRGMQATSGPSIAPDEAAEAAETGNGRAEWPQAGNNRPPASSSTHALTTPGEGPDEPHAEEIDVEADADGGDPNVAAERFDALMQGAPTFFDSLIERAAPRASAPAAQTPPQLPAGFTFPVREPRYQRVAQQPQALPQQRNGLQRLGVRPDHRRGYGVPAGSLTRPIGISQPGGNIQGDGFGNVMRDNMSHFGMVGTRSR